MFGAGEFLLTVNSGLDFQHSGRGCRAAFARVHQRDRVGDGNSLSVAKDR